MRTAENISERESLKHLTDLYIQESKRKHPTVPYHFAPKWHINTTNGLTSAVMTFLRLQGHHVERTGNEGRILDNRRMFIDTVGRTRIVGSVKRISGSGLRGTSDLKAIIGGRFIAIEIKNRYTHDRQRPEQKSYQRQVEAAGGVYLIVRDFTSFIDWYQEYTQSHKQSNGG